MDWEYFEDTADFVRLLHAQDFCVLSVEQVEHSVKLQNLDRDLFKSSSESGDQDNETKTCRRKYAVVLGNEVKGVRQDVVDMSDGCLEIPQFGTKHSLNVSITGGIVVWEFAKRMVPEL